MHDGKPERRSDQRRRADDLLVRVPPAPAGDRGCGERREDGCEQELLHRRRPVEVTPCRSRASRSSPEPLSRIQFLQTMRRLLVSVLLCVLLLAGSAGAPHAANAKRVLAIHFTSDVNPVTQDWVNSELSHAASHGYAAAVLVVDTPGGLEESMRKIVQRELSVQIPVVVYVAPDGARAASAGVWISQAADVLAMAPNTNIGSSTPIDFGGGNVPSDLHRKVVNDAAASLRALAQSHGRNVKWADAAVRVA